MGYVNYLNHFGDITIAWDDDADEKMLSIIQKQIDQGMTFWEIEPRFFGLVKPKKTKLKSIDDIKDERVLSIKDEDFFKLVADGLADAVNVNHDYSEKPKRRLKTAQEVVKAKSSRAIKPLVGG